MADGLTCADEDGRARFLGPVLERPGVLGCAWSFDVDPLAHVMLASNAVAPWSRYEHTAAYEIRSHF